jgi:hypothetical protein
MTNTFYFETKSTKQASYCEMRGCEINMELDYAAEAPGQVLFQISPSKDAQRFIQELQAGATAPAWQMMQAHADLHRRLKRFRNGQTV